MNALIIDDDAGDQRHIRAAVTEAGIAATDDTCVISLTSAKARFDAHRPDIVLLDLFFFKDDLKKERGFFCNDFVRHVRSSTRPWPEIIAVTGKREALQHQNELFDWIAQGLLADVVHKGLADLGWRLFEMVLTLKLRRLRRDIDSKPQLQAIDEKYDEMAKHGILTQDPAMADIWTRLKAAAEWSIADPMPLPVLITGERGTGKELFAKAFHQLSDRRKKPYVILDCPCISRELFESKLFGHEIGAFSGASQSRAGMAAMADGGILFMDEVGDIPLEIQPKFLRFLETGELARVGSDKTLKVDVRVVAATNKDLLQEVQHERFRGDLYDRIAKQRIVLPPLRHRKQDVPFLAQSFLGRYNQEAKKGVSLSAELLRWMSGYEWPGNVRRLQSFVQDVLIHEGGEVSLEAGLKHFSEASGSRSPARMFARSSQGLEDLMTAEGVKAFSHVCDSLQLEDKARQAIKRALEWVGTYKEIASGRFIDITEICKTRAVEHLNILTEHGILKREGGGAQTKYVPKYVPDQGEPYLWNSPPEPQRD